jgi:restriction endonuclease S subunit
MEVREPNARYLVKPAFKQTEVGVIPEDWISPSIKEIAANRPNAIVGGPFGSDLVSKDYVASGVPVIRGQNMAQHYVSGDFVFVSKQKAKFLQANTARTKDIVFTQRGTLGQISIVPGKPFLEYVVSQSQMKLTLNSEMADPEYVYQYFVSAGGQRQILDSAIQTGVPHTNLGILRSYRVPAPPTVVEQQAIAEALSDADALIESLEQLLTKKRQIKQGAMQELLTGQKRLPGFAGDWGKKRLEELADIRSGGTPSTLLPEFWDGDILWCTPTDITALNGYKYLGETSRKITSLGLIASSAEIVPAMSIVMTSRATIGECAINRVSLSTNQGFKNFVPFDEVDVEFLYYLLTTQKQDFIRLCGGSTFLEIGKAQLAAFEVNLPATKAEQTAIATVLSDLDAELAALEAKLTKARQLKQGMMQELLTGRIRLVQSKAEVISFPVHETKTEKPRAHNPQIEEAVMLGVLANAFGTEKNPLARVRRTKLLYLLHRHIEGRAEGYLKKAAGPYNPKTRYQGGERIAVKNAYVRPLHNGTWEGFVAGAKVAEAEAYFDKWYEPAVRTWLEQFRYMKTEELELLATVDMAVDDLRSASSLVTLDSVKEVIRSNPEWQAKLDRPIFSDDNIERAIIRCNTLFGEH